MPSPEINVRLTADGVQDVVNAFKRVQQESQTTKENVGMLNDVMGEFSELLPVISIGAAVAGVVELGKGALDSAVSIGKLAQETGASAGTLSVLVMAAHDVGVSQDEMGQALVRLARNQEQASTGNVKAKKAFDDLGISMADIKSKNPADLFVEIAQKLQGMPDGATKTAAAMQLFGRSGAQLIPVLNEIGASNGFELAKEKAQAFGLYLSDDFVANAKAGEEALRNMQDVTQGFALQFMSGFVPQIAKGMTDVTNAVSGGGSNAFKSFGDFAGNVVRGIVNEFLILGQTVMVVWTSMTKGLEGYAKTALDVSKKMSGMDYLGAWDSLKGGLSGVANEQFSIWSDYTNKVNTEAYGKPAAVTLPKGTSGSPGASGNGLSPADIAKAESERRKLIDSRAAYEDAVGNAELQKQKLRDTQAEAEDKAAYDAGLETLKAYYDARASRINAESDAEEALLQKKLDEQENAAAQLLGKTKDYIAGVVALGPAAVEAAAGSNTQALAMLGKIATTKAQIDEDELKRQTQLQQNETARHQAALQASQQILSDRQKLYELEGNTSAAQQVALQKELNDTEQLLIKLGVGEAQRKAILSQAAANAGAKSSMAGLSQQGGDAMTGLNTATSAVQDRASSGIISDLSAEAQIFSLEKARLPVLQSIAQKMQDVVDQNELQLLYLTPDTDAYNAQLAVVNNLQKTVDTYTQQVNKLAAGLQTTKTFSVELSNQLSTQGTGAAVTFFDEWTTGSKSFSSALTDMGNTFEKMITHMIDQMLVYYALMAIIGWIPGLQGSSFATSLAKSGPFGGLTGHQEGGYTGNGSTSQIAGFVHGQEFVTTAQATAQYRPLLEAMNAGTVGSVANSSTYGSMGSIAGAGAGAGAVQVNITNTTGQPTSASQRQGQGGQSIIDVVVGQVASDIASGGKVGQTIQSTYGVSRKGIIRG